MFRVVWTESAAQTYNELKEAARKSLKARSKKTKKKASRQEGLFKQVHKCIQLLCTNPRHPGLNTHAYHSLVNPYDSNGKVFEAHVQQHTPGAFRVFWCYGPKKEEITILAITPHP
ncbi:MAG: hypothetical protein GXP49_01180 [Deltaproteobacteria bacterium]|nr:hypothetical protein [Deltaproteobacteria bacterium]